MSKPTCETCQAWRRYQRTTPDTQGSCHIKPVSHPKNATDFCMQHIPIETECEHFYTYDGNGIRRCDKCGDAKPLEIHMTVTRSKPSEGEPQNKTHSSNFPS